MDAFVTAEKTASQKTVTNKSGGSKSDVCDDDISHVTSATQKDKEPYSKMKFEDNFAGKTERALYRKGTIRAFDGF